MPERPALILSLVERGWRAARECSLDIQRDGVCVLHLVKGRLDPELRWLVVREPTTRLISVARRWFWPVAWLVFLRCLSSGRLRSVLVDNERSFRRLQRWTRLTHVNLVMVREGPEGYQLWADHHQVPRAAWHETLGIHADCAHLR